MSDCGKCANSKKLFGGMYYCEYLQFTTYTRINCGGFKSKNKYHNSKTVNDAGIKFDSKKESSRYEELKILEKCGSIKNLKRQVKFQIIPKTETEMVAYYVADFTYTQNDQDIVEDVKSKITKKNPAYILKRKLMKYLYPDKKFVES